ncbi:MAG: hypothetical protein IKP28_04800 [Clostridia bacterium]|nr:hypothetical protein [Clostridia bacterium]
MNLIKYIRKESTCKEAGITLIALVITVIVLLILAGVAISMATSQDSIFEKSNTATSTWNNKVSEEETSITGLLNYMNGLLPTEVDFEAKKTEALANRQETEAIAIGTDGNPVDLSLWAYDIVDNKIRLGVDIGYGMYGRGYLGDIINGQIVGKMPQYVMPEGDTQFYPVAYIPRVFQWIESLVTPPEIPSTVEDMERCI